MYFSNNFCVCSSVYNFCAPKISSMNSLGGLSKLHICGKISIIMTFGGGGGGRVLDIIPSFYIKSIRRYQEV